MGSITLISYLAFRLVGLIRANRWSATGAAASAALFLAALVGVNLMFLAPRVAYVGETSLSLGYPKLAALGRMLFKAPAVAYEPGLGAGPGWPLTLASSPGAYLGAAVLLGAWLAFSGRWRSLAWPFVVTGVVVYLASLAVIADAIPDALGRSLIVGLYLHAPYWIGYELVLVLPVLGAIGLASWPEAGSSARRIAVGCSAAVLVILPLLLGVGGANAGGGGCRSGRGGGDTVAGLQQAQGGVGAAVRPDTGAGSRPDRVGARHRHQGTRTDPGEHLAAQPLPAHPPGGAQRLAVPAPSEPAGQRPIHPHRHVSRQNTTPSRTAPSTGRPSPPGC